ncbi:MAG: GHKL domain-containing protein [Lachnospiraceae bacterium]|nr:GHKL domain-containing protein [Lachnospiraceae bacterium]
METKKKLLVLYGCIAVISLLAFEYAFWSNGFVYLTERSEKGYLTQAELLRDLFVAENPEGYDDIQAFADTYGQAYRLRITIIDRKGQVAGESGSQEVPMTSHLNREEVKLALAGEASSVIRRSPTFGTDYCYCAVPLETAGFSGVMRVAVPLEELRDMEGEFIRSTLLALAILILVILGLFMYFRQYVSAMKRVEELRREFVANVTHELKTPLTSIRGFVETLQEGAIKDEAYAGKFLDIIQGETKRLSNLIDDTLLLSEIESGKEIQRKPEDINEVIARVVELMGPRVKKHVRLIFQADENVPPFPCNRDRMEQLVINLVDNGLKATEFGAVTITLRSSNRHLILEVADTGIGMEEEQLERIFERFYRVDKGRSRSQGGTGLGLSIVKHIVESYHGTIRVHSKPGEGTEIQVRMPY